MKNAPRVKCSSETAAPVVTSSGFIAIETAWTPTTQTNVMRRTTSTACT